MEEICKKDLCCGCGLCKAQCPCGAIDMCPDVEGFLYPCINESKCISCRKCREACPVVNDRSYGINRVEKPERCPMIYSGYKKQFSELLKSSAGGAAHSISRVVIEDGGVVFGVRYKEGYRGACFNMASSEAELAQFNESKYVESDREFLYTHLPEAISSGRKVLVIGLPCDIAAVRSLVGNPDNLYTCKLVCRSNTSNRALYDFLDRCEEDAHSDIAKLSLRYKEAGRPTLPTRYRIEFKNGTVRMGDFTKSDYGKAFQILARPSCFNCSAKKIEDLSDLTLGDFQGLTETDPLYKVNGVSLICEHTDKGKELLQKTSDLCLKEVEKETAWKYNWMIYTSIPKSPFRDAFSQRFIQFGLRRACGELCKEQNIILDDIKNEFFNTGKPVAVWGAGDTAVYLFSRLDMDNWNIKEIFDGSEMKIGKTFRGHEIMDIKKIGRMNGQIEALIAMIPSENEAKLEKILLGYGWRGRTIHVGKYKFYREEP